MASEMECPPTWLFTELVELKRSAQPSTVERVAIPEQLLRMRENENDTIPEVFNLTPIFCITLSAT